MAEKDKELDNDQEKTIAKKPLSEEDVMQMSEEEFNALYNEGDIDLYSQEDGKADDENQDASPDEGDKEDEESKEAKEEEGEDAKADADGEADKADTEMSAASDDKKAKGDEKESDKKEELEDNKSKEDEEKEEIFKGNDEMTIKVRGKNHKLTVSEAMKNFQGIYSQAMDYTFKTQKLKPWSRTINALQTEGIEAKDVDMFISALKGKQDAIKEIVKKSGVDIVDLMDSEGKLADSNYERVEYGVDDSKAGIEEIISELKTRQGWSTTERVLGKEWDENSLQVIEKNPELIRDFHEDVESGRYEKIQLIADRMRVFGNKGSSIELYQQAAKRYFADASKEEAKKAESNEAEKDKIQQAKVEAEKRSLAEQQAKKRKSAATTKNKISIDDDPKNIDIMGMSDENFKKFFDKQFGSVHV